MNKNIIVFHLDDSKNLRGGERQVLYLAKELKELGVENYIAARNNSPLFNKCIEEKIPVITLPYIFEWDIISAFILALKIKKINKNNKKIIIHTHTGHTPAIAILTNIFIKTKIAVHRRVDFKIKNNFLSQIKYKKADIVISISNAIKNILIQSELPESKIVVISSSIDKTVLSPNNIKNEKKDVIKIGSLIALEPHKDPLNLIKAANLCLKTNPNLIFLIGGEGSLKKGTDKLIKDFNIGDKVKLLGYVEKNMDFLKSIDIFVLSSKEEGLGSVLIEAMSVGLPLIGTNAGGIAELIKDNFNGLIVPKENPDELSKAILKMAEDEDMRLKFSKNSLEMVSEFTSDKMALKTLEVYEKIIKNS